MAGRPYTCPGNRRRRPNKSIGAFARQTAHVHLYSRICSRRTTLQRPRHSLSDPRHQPGIFLAVAGDVMLLGFTAADRAMMREHVLEFMGTKD